MGSSRPLAARWLKSGAPDLSATLINRSRAKFDPASYESAAYSGLGGKFASNLELSDILKCPAIALSVLEIGVGTGRVFEKLASRSGYAVGIDRDPKMARHVAQRMRQSDGLKPSNIELIVADGEHLPFRRAAFEQVVCIRVLRYFEEPQKAIHGMSEVLKSGGWLVAEFANVLRPHTILQVPGYLAKGEFYPRLFSRRKISEWITGQGFEVHQLIGWHKIPVEILSNASNPAVLRILLGFETALQKLSPPEFMSRSLFLSALKIDS